MKPAHLLFSQLAALIPSRSIFGKMLVIFSGGEFLNTVLYRNSRKQEESRSRPPKKWLRRSRATTAKKYVQKSVMNVQSCCITKYKHIDLLFVSLLSIYS